MSTGGLPPDERWIENSKWQMARTLRDADWTMPITSDQVNDDDGGGGGDSDRECQSAWLATSAWQAIWLRQLKSRERERMEGKLNINRSTIYH